MRIYAYLALVFGCSLAHAQVVTQENVKQGNTKVGSGSYPKEKVILDKVNYEDRVYSNSKKTELGDSSDFGMSLRYQRDNESFARFRFATDPSGDRKANKTSNFELIYNRVSGPFTFQVDLNLQTNEEIGGEMTGNNLGLDLDSDNTYISYKFSKFETTFYPFNFRADVGDEFNTSDVTRIYYIEGSPTTILATPVNGEEIISKTIPGFEFKYKFSKSYLYAGFGIASYLHPINNNFDYTSNPSADAWERREVTAYKLGFLHNITGQRKFFMQYVYQNKSEETGVLLESAASVSYFQVWKRLVFEIESTVSKAGKAPLNVDYEEGWFSDTTLFRPVYSDIDGDEQDWVGKNDSGLSLKIGYNLEKYTPYIAYKYQGKYFVYNGAESAHRLRTSDESKSHGGLTRVAVGSIFYYKNLSFRPQVEYQQAVNAVFSNSTDVTSDKQQSSYKKENILLSIQLNYGFDGSNLNQNWWF